ncbi:ATP-binding cassette domain-containing protein [Streptomyces canus]|uniref:ATP-binding cassette domain-containing protein n=1 Tax=Streptomyces canus TaxID=58343 RepID=UPI003681C988
MASTAGAALSLRWMVDAAVRGATDTAVAAALGAALSCAAGVALAGVADNLPVQLADKVFVFDIHPRIYRWIAEIEGLDHLERTDFLDRVEEVRGGGWQICVSLWTAVLVAQTVLQLGVTLLLLGVVSPWLPALLLFAALPVWFDRRGKRTVARVEAGTAELHRLQRHLFAVATDADSGKDIHVAGAGEELTRRQTAAWDQATRERHRARVRAAWWQFLGWTVFACGFTGALALVTHRVVEGRGTVGDVVMVVTVASGLRQTVQHVVRGTTQTLAVRTALEAYFWLRDYATADRARRTGSAPPPARLRDGIAFEGVSFQYPGTNRPAVDNVSIRIPAATVVAIVGEYGSGKTTLVKLLGRFYQPDKGRITLDGVDLASLDARGWRSRISATFQDFGRLKAALAESVGLGDLLRLDDRKAIGRALQEVDASALVDQLPQGLDTPLSRDLGGVELSEGQWQRVALARSTMREDPLLFILDEPTASLDAPSEHALFSRQMARARRLASRTGAITVIVSHRFSTVTEADLILVLDQGRLIECGSHVELMALENGRYADLYGIQQRAYRTD